MKKALGMVFATVVAAGMVVAPSTSFATVNGNASSQQVVSPDAYDEVFGAIDSHYQYSGLNDKVVEFDCSFGGGSGTYSATMYFGDGKSQTKTFYSSSGTFSHSYSSYGDYHVTLIVKSAGLTAERDYYEFTLDY